MKKMIRPALSGQPCFILIYIVFLSRGAITYAQYFRQLTNFIPFKTIIEYVQRYHIVIKMHAGYRVGDLSVDLEDEKVSGMIHAPFFEPQFCGKMNDDGTLSLSLTVNAEGKPQDCESTGRIGMYAIHISVPAAAFTYEIDGTSLRTSIS